MFNTTVMDRRIGQPIVWPELSDPAAVANFVPQPTDLLDILSLSRELYANGRVCGPFAAIRHQPPLRGWFGGSLEQTTAPSNPEATHFCALGSLYGAAAMLGLSPLYVHPAERLLTAAARQTLPAEWPGPCGIAWLNDHEMLPTDQMLTFWDVAAGLINPK